MKNNCHQNNHLNKKRTHRVSIVALMTTLIVFSAIVYSIKECVKHYSIQHILLQATHQ